ncbi:non-functional pseudokinase ZED1-like [Nicotiana tabacum]|uniref:Non-functional pseudokinase ZED1-like n=1 Tax=Nicotiana tabacum TaxID=4097 RepID=A0AC58RNS4_TOBAC
MRAAAAVRRGLDVAAGTQQEGEATDRSKKEVDLVYEYSQFNYFFKLFSPSCENFLTWEKRVKIAIDVATVILYLHTEFPTPVIHRNLTSSNVILDQNGVVKLYNFECCIPLPIGKVKVQDDLIGIIGYLDPEYVWSSNVTLKSDVFSFGLFLLMLLSGKEIRVNHEGKYYTEDYGLVSLENYASKCVENNKKKLKAFLNLALKCAQKVGEDRPNMINVAKELQRIKKGSLLFVYKYILHMPHRFLLSLKFITIALFHGCSLMPRYPGAYAA